MEWLFPSRARCVCCGDATGQERPWLCEVCRETLSGMIIGPKAARGFDGAAFAYRYGGPAKALVLGLKYSGWRAMAKDMAKSMAEVWTLTGIADADGIVCVPMHPKRRRKRGFNHAEALALETAALIGLPFEDALARTRNTVQQAKLNGEARRKNLCGAFSSKPLPGRRVILVDDVFTTGTTARECAKALRDAGAETVYLLTFSRSEKE